MFSFHQFLVPFYFSLFFWYIVFIFVFRSNLEKSFKKNIDGGYFPFLIVDAVNEKVISIFNIEAINLFNVLHSSTLCRLTILEECGATQNRMVLR